MPAWRNFDPWTIRCREAMGSRRPAILATHCDSSYLGVFVWERVTKCQSAGSALRSWRIDWIETVAGMRQTPVCRLAMAPICPPQVCPLDTSLERRYG
jgi:hypothetical protein